VVYEACIGCSICADVCPEPDCVVMVNELAFSNNDNLYPLYASDPDAYRALLTQHGIPLHPELIEKAQKTPAVHRQPAPVAGGQE
jgi:formate hydrogenlyase subunit 6/NADH:ubiquinone oxidoreductase subunit I